MTNTRPRALGAATVATAVGVLAVLAVAVHAPPPGSLDDVYVPLYEARGWLAEFGFGDRVASASGLAAPEVEGSTSALDVVVKALGLYVCPGADPLRLAGWVGLGWMLAFLFVFALYAARCTGSTLETSLFTLGIGTSLGLVESASYRLEGPLFALAWLGLLLAAGHGRFWTAAALSLLVVLARPEGLLLAPGLLVWASGPQRRARGALVGGAVVTVVTVVRFAAYGSLVPNTFYAKSSDDRLLEIADGAVYFANAVATPAGIALVVLFVAAALTSTAETRARKRTLGWLWTCTAAAVVLIVSGGDGYPGARLALPLAAPIWLAATTVGQSGSVRVAVAIAIACQLGSAIPAPWPGLSKGLDQTRTAIVAGPSGSEIFAGEPALFRRVATALDGETFAHRHAQRFRWFEPTTPVLDLTGLTDAAIARTPAPGPVRFGRDALAEAVEQRVGAIYLDTGTSGREPLVHSDLERALTDPVVSERFFGPYVVDRALARTIAARYSAASASNPIQGGAFNILVRRDLADRFREQGFDLR